MAHWMSDSGARTKLIGWSFDCVRSARTLDRRLIGDGHLEAVVVERDGHRHVLAHDLLGDQREGLWLRIVPPEVDDGHVQQIRQKERQLPLVQRPHAHEGLADPLAGLLLDDEGLRDVVLADEATSDQQRSEGLGADGVAGPVLGFVDGDRRGQTVRPRPARTTSRSARGP